mgnify:CR=1 FL=1
MKKVGMVLEGGGLRGLFTAGVLDTLLENKIKVDCIIGVSAGALFGANYFSNQKGRALRYNKNYLGDKRYISKRSLFLTGNLINKKFTYYKITKEDLYKCYNTFYHPSNMVMCFAGDFDPEELIKDVRKRLKNTEQHGEIKRIYPEEPEEISRKETST